MTLNDTTYAALADATLNRLAEMAESLDDDGQLDVELLSGVLTIELTDGRQFVVNRHAPSKQIWLSSPLSGALYFAYDEAEKAWALKDGTRLDTLLKAELLTLMGDE